MADQPDQPSAPGASDLGPLTRAVEDGDRRTAVALTSEALAAGVPARTILDAMTAAMDAVGGRFQRGEIYVPEMLIAARAMKEGMAILEPVLVGEGFRPEHRAVIGTISGDLHDIGKNLVAMMWKGANIEVFDLGTNVAPARFVEAAREHDARLVGVSALLTTTMVGMKDVVAAFREAGMDDVRILVGGAPVTAEWAAEIGAHGYAPDAGSAVEAARAALAG